MLGLGQADLVKEAVLAHGEDRGRGLAEHALLHRQRLAMGVAPVGLDDAAPQVPQGGGRADQRLHARGDLVRRPVVLVDHPLGPRPEQLQRHGQAVQFVAVHGAERVGDARRPTAAAVGADGQAHGGLVAPRQGGERRRLGRGQRRVDAGPGDLGAVQGQPRPGVAAVLGVAQDGHARGRGVTPDLVPPPARDDGAVAHLAARRAVQPFERGAGRLAVQFVVAGPGVAGPAGRGVDVRPELVDLARGALFVDLLRPRRRRRRARQQQHAAGAAIQARDHVAGQVQVQVQPLDGAQLARLPGVRGQTGGFVHHEPVVVPIEDHCGLRAGAPSRCSPSRATNSVSRARPRSRP